MGLYDRDYALAPEALERTRAKARKGRSRRPASFAGIEVPDALGSELALHGSRVELAQQRKRGGPWSWFALIVGAVAGALARR